MTHELEKTFGDRVEEHLVEHYGADNVEREKYLPEPYRFVDFWVSGPVVDLAIEVENDFESLMTGIGQAQLYAAHRDAVPVVIVPEDHIDHPEMEMVKEQVQVMEY